MSEPHDMDKARAALGRVKHALAEAARLREENGKMRKMLAGYRCIDVGPFGEQFLHALREAITLHARVIELEAQLQAIEDWAQRKHTTQVDPPDPRWSTALGEVRVRDAALAHTLEEEQARVAELEGNLESETRWAKEYHDKLVVAKRERDTLGAESARLREEDRKLSAMLVEHSNALHRLAQTLLMRWPAVREEGR